MSISDSPSITYIPVEDSLSSTITIVSSRPFLRLSSYVLRLLLIGAPKLPNSLAFIPPALSRAGFCLSFYPRALFRAFSLLCLIKISWKFCQHEGLPTYSELLFLLCFLFFSHVFHFLYSLVMVILSQLLLRHVIWIKLFFILFRWKQEVLNIVHQTFKCYFCDINLFVRSLKSLYLHLLSLLMIFNIRSWAILGIIFWITTDL